jgi:signal transduction histidine kinase
VTGVTYSGALSGLARTSGSVDRLEAPGPEGEDVVQAGLPHADRGHQELREACHDMRQAVAAVRTLADAALADQGLQGAARAHVEKIADQAEILADTIREQLCSADGDQRCRRLIDLRRLITDAADGERLTYQGTLEVIAGPAPVLIHAKRDDVRRVLSNLLGNATRAAGPAGSVVIEVKTESRVAEVVIDNTGPTFAEVPEGTGLGWGIIAQRLPGIGGKLAYGRGRRGGVQATLWLPLAVSLPRRLGHATRSL